MKHIISFPNDISSIDHKFFDKIFRGIERALILELEEKGINFSETILMHMAQAYCKRIGHIIDFTGEERDPKFKREFYNLVHGMIKE